MVGAFKRLVDPTQMGVRYKVLALVDSKQPALPPGGFLDDTARPENPNRNRELALALDK